MVVKNLLKKINRRPALRASVLAGLVLLAACGPAVEDKQSSQAQPQAERELRQKNEQVVGDEVDDKDGRARQAKPAAAEPVLEKKQQPVSAPGEGLSDEGDDMERMD